MPAFVDYKDNGGIMKKQQKEYMGRMPGNFNAWDMPWLKSVLAELPVSVANRGAGGYNIEYKRVLALESGVDRYNLAGRAANIALRGWVKSLEREIIPPPEAKGLALSSKAITIEIVL